jgi:hypothetical protein
MRKPVKLRNKQKPQTSRKLPRKHPAENIGRKLLDIIVYNRNSQAGDSLTVDDLVEASEIGNWKMPDFRMAYTYAASQGWLIVENDTLTLTTAGLRA